MAEQRAGGNPGATRWVVDLEWNGPSGLFSGKHHESATVWAYTPEEAVELAFAKMSVLAHRQGIVARPYRVERKPVGRWRSGYEHPDKDTGPHEHLPDYGKRLTVKL